MKRLIGLLLLNFGFLLNSNAVPPVLNYAGQVAVNGEAFNGNGLFKFALINADGTTTHWSNDGTSVDGSEPQTSVSVSVNGGLYAVLLGNTAQQGMGAIHPAVFAQHTDAKLRIWFSDGVNGFQQLSPDRPFASVPFAFSAGTAQTAGSATIAPSSIDRSMLSGDIRSDLNRTISHNDLSPQIKADINATIGLDRLSPEVISKLEQNATITNGSVSRSKMAEGAVTASKIASNTITTNELSEQILKYLKPEITSQPQASTIYAGGDGSVSFSAEGKYLTYQWKKDGVDLTGETNATLNITDANATLHDGNYSVVVGNDFGSVESVDFVLDVNITWSTDGLVGWWKFDEGSGTVAYDSSTNSNHALFNGIPTWVGGKLNGALKFDGDDFLVTNGNLNLQGNAPRTITTWWNPTQVGSVRGIVSLGINSPKKTFEIIAQSQGAAIHIDGSTLLGGSFQINNWYSLCGSSDGQTTKLFINGVLVKQQNFTLNTQLNNVLIGKARISSIGKAYGLIDDVRIYDRALSAKEVQALYKLGQ